MPVEDFTLRQVDNVLVIQVKLNNLLGVTEVNRMGGKLDELVKDQPRKIALDLSNVRYAGSAALGMLVSLSKSLSARGGKLILCGTQHLDTLFKVSRTIAVFEVAPDVDGAVQVLKK
jgi:anti-anti-sigma factor